MSSIDIAKCRYCGKLLRGPAHYLGGEAYLPKEDGGIWNAPKNYYGGYVCSRKCDELACLAVARSMPGTGPAHELDENERAKVEKNWREIEQSRSRRR